MGISLLVTKWIELIVTAFDNYIHRVEKTRERTLEKLLKTEEDLNNFKISQNPGEAFNGVYTYVQDA